MSVDKTPAVDPWELAYKIHCMLRILSLAFDGTEISTRTIENSGGSQFIDLIAEMTEQLVEFLELNRVG